MKTLSLKTGLLLKKHNLLLATAESCTAGLIASTIAQTPGSSAWLDAGFVVYSPEAKNKSLGVKLETIEKYNITSKEVALEMAIGAIKNSRANFSIATTGVAGPSGGTDDIPVGTVCFAWAIKNHNNIISFSDKQIFTGDRNQIRNKAVKFALQQIPNYLIF